MIAGSFTEVIMKVRRLTDMQALNAVSAATRPAVVTPKKASARAVKAAAIDVAGKNQPPPSDAELFRSLIGPVRSFVAPMAPQTSPPPLPDAAMSRADEAHVIEELFDLPDDPALIDGAEQISYLANGHSPKLLRKLKRGQFRIADEFDLHHMTSTVAKKALHQFLHAARAAGKACVLMVHGKGLRSGDAGAVLKSMVDFELRRRKDVVAFASAPPGLGGAGAVLVLLR
jgi:DNA-nicking Smr family endonuclease